jgi:hypothetical protein
VRNVLLNQKTPLEKGLIVLLAFFYCKTANLFSRAWLRRSEIAKVFMLNLYHPGVYMSNYTIKKLSVYPGNSSSWRLSSGIPMPISLAWKAWTMGSGPDT